MLNKVMIIGRLGGDPELRYTGNGTPVTTLNVATDESYTDRDGNRQERTEWHRVSVYQRQAENCANYLRKGSLVYVEGSLQTRKWQDQQGQNRYSTEIRAQRVQFLDRKNDGMRGGDGEDGGQGGGWQNRPQRQYQNNGQHGGNHAPQGQGGQDFQGQGGPGGGMGGGFPGDDMGSPFPSGAAGMDQVPF